MKKILYDQAKCLDTTLYCLWWICISSTLNKFKFRQFPELVRTLLLSADIIGIYHLWLKSLYLSQWIHACYDGKMPRKNMKSWCVSGDGGLLSDATEWNLFIGLLQVVFFKTLNLDLVIWRAPKLGSVQYWISRADSVNVHLTLFLQAQCQRDSLKKPVVWINCLESQHFAFILMCDISEYNISASQSNFS